jgi:hypothetical protein
LERGKKKEEGLMPLLDAPLQRGVRLRRIERGRSPLSLRLPSPARNNPGFLHNTGWRGVRGEEILPWKDSHMQSKKSFYIFTRRLYL